MAERVNTNFTSISWIPSEAIEGFMRRPIDLGLGRYDHPPPDHIEDLEEFVSGEGCRFANHLSAWADIEDGRIVAAGTEGGGLLAPTRVGPGGIMSIPPIAHPEIRSTEWDDDQAVTFIQTAGGRTGAPYPRRAGETKRFMMTSPTAWTTLAITIDASGQCSTQVAGASAFPRHWFYDENLTLTAKSPTIEYDEWTSGLHDQDTPWASSDRPAETTAVETPLERELSLTIMNDGPNPDIRELDAGTTLMLKGEEATTIALILDGMVEIDIDGEVIAECGPGSVLGERSFLEQGLRTSTVRAKTRIKVAETSPDHLDLDHLEELGRHHGAKQPGS